MIDATLIPWILAGIPLLGAALSPAFWAHPHRLMAWSVGVCAVSLASLMGFAGFLTTPPEGLLLLFLLPLAAGMSLLGQPHHKDHRASWVLTLLFLSLGLGALTSQPVVGKLFLMAIHGFVIVLLYRHHTPLWPISWWGLGAYTPRRPVPVADTGRRPAAVFDGGAAGLYDSLTRRAVSRWTSHRTDPVARQFAVVHGPALSGARPA